MVETVWQGRDYEIIINSAGRRHCRDRDTKTFVSMEKCTRERAEQKPRKLIGKSFTVGQYRAGIVAFGGATQYKTCGNKKEKGFLAVAKCLEEARKEKLTTDTMVKRYGSRA